MTRYRVVTIVDGNGRTTYAPQEKGWFFWHFHYHGLLIRQGRVEFNSQQGAKSYIQGLRLRAKANKIGITDKQEIYDGEGITY